MNVLIIEDDQDICHLYSIWLQECNYNYVITNNVLVVIVSLALILTPYYIK